MNLEAGKRSGRGLRWEVVRCPIVYWQEEWRDMTADVLKKFKYGKEVFKRRKEIWIDFLL